MKTLILGGVRSGKSRLAEKLASASQLPVTYVATARQSDDREMHARIEAHRAIRPKHWQTIEEPICLGRVLRESFQPGRCVIVDCLTLWLTNLLLSEDEQLLAGQCEDLLLALGNAGDHDGRLILVGNETGLGIIPLGELSRRFCDEAGQLHQQLARLCDQVVMTVAGLALALKGPPLE